MDVNLMKVRYKELTQLTEDPNVWLESRYGSDLWVDGLNVFLSVATDDFQAGLEWFLQEYPYDSTSRIDCIRALHQYCLDAAKEGEYELYQAMAVGMVYLTLCPEVNGQFFNIPVQITNHSLAVLLSPTYREIWVHSYLAGLELVVDIEASRASVFRPEHGRIYQKGTWHQPGEVIRYPFNHFFHEMAHILLFADLYARVLGTSDEDRSTFAHMEAVITCLEEVVFEELMAVRHDLNLIDDAFGKMALFDDASEFRMSVFRGQVDGVTPRSLTSYLKRSFQLGEGEKRIPENRIKQAILQNHRITDLEIQKITPSYQRLIDNLQGHSLWGEEAARRNRLPAYREVVELLRPDPVALQKLEEMLQPDRWETPVSSILSESLPEPDSDIRNQNQVKRRMRELVFRVAEIRGYVELAAEGCERSVLFRLLDLAKRIATALDGDVVVDEVYETMFKDITECLRSIEDPELQRAAVKMMDDPFTYLLEPR